MIDHVRIRESANRALGKGGGLHPVVTAETLALDSLELLADVEAKDVRIARLELALKEACDIAEDAFTYDHNHPKLLPSLTRIAEFRKLLGR